MRPLFFLNGQKYMLTNPGLQDLVTKPSQVWAFLTLVICHREHSEYPPLATLPLTVKISLIKAHRPIKVKYLKNML